MITALSMVSASALYSDDDEPSVMTTALSVISERGSYSSDDEALILLL
jgi:hypothetical protein